MGISILAIRSSFELIKPIAKDVADRFYQNLFDDFPESRALFAAVDMERQKIALIGSLKTTVNNLDNPDELTHFLLALGERHVRYGAEDIHYDWVGASLLKTFGEFLGNQWTAELRQQWTTIYGVVAEAMKAGAKNASRPAPHLHVVQKEEIDREIEMTPENTTSADHVTALTSGLVLPESLREQIRRSVEATVLGLVKAEVIRQFAEELKRIEGLSAEEIVRLAC